MTNNTLGCSVAIHSLGCHTHQVHYLNLVHYLSFSCMGLVLGEITLNITRSDCSKYCSNVLPQDVVKWCLHTLHLVVIHNWGGVGWGGVWGLRGYHTGEGDVLTSDMTAMGVLELTLATSCSIRKNMYSS